MFGEVPPRSLLDQERKHLDEDLLTRSLERWTQAPKRFDLHRLREEGFTDQQVARFLLENGEARILKTNLSQFTELDANIAIDLVYADQFNVGCARAVLVY